MAEHRETRQEQVQTSASALTYGLVRFLKLPQADIIVENEHGALIGIEIKARATVHASDFKGMRKLLDICGDDLNLGLVLYDGTKIVPFGDRLFAAPISCLWT